MKRNLVILGLNYEYNKIICDDISAKTDLFLLEVNDYINYSLMSAKRVENICGISYLQKKENEVIKNCADFENTVMSIPTLYYFRNENHKLFNESFLVYLKFSKEYLDKISSEQSNKNSTLDVDLLVFDERDEQLNNSCGLVIDVENKSKEMVVKEILQQIKGEI